MASELPAFWTSGNVLYRTAAGGRIEWMIFNSWRKSFRSPNDVAKMIRTGDAWPCDENGERLPVGERAVR